MSRCHKQREKLAAKLQSASMENHALREQVRLLRQERGLPWAGPQVTTPHAQVPDIDPPAYPYTAGDHCCSSTDTRECCSRQCWRRTRSPPRRRSPSSRHLSRRSPSPPLLHRRSPSPPRLHLRRSSPRWLHHRRSVSPPQHTHTSLVKSRLEDEEGYVEELLRQYRRRSVIQREPLGIGNSSTSDITDLELRLQQLREREKRQTLEGAALRLEQEIGDTRRLMSLKRAQQERDISVLGAPRPDILRSTKSKWWNDLLVQPPPIHIYDPLVPPEPEDDSPGAEARRLRAAVVQADAVVAGQRYQRQIQEKRDWDELKLKSCFLCGKLETPPKFCYLCGKKQD